MIMILNPPYTLGQNNYQPQKTSSRVEKTCLNAEGFMVCLFTLVRKTHVYDQGFMPYLFTFLRKPKNWWKAKSNVWSRACHLRPGIPKRLWFWLIWHWYLSIYVYLPRIHKCSWDIWSRIQGFFVINYKFTVFTCFHMIPHE